MCVFSYDLFTLFKIQQNYALSWYFFFSSKIYMHGFTLLFIIVHPSTASVQEESNIIWIIVIAICLTALICVSIFFLINKRITSKQNRGKKLTDSSFSFNYRLCSPALASQEGSILLLYPDQNSYLQLYIDEFKQSLNERLPNYQVKTLA